MDCKPNFLFLQYCDIRHFLKLQTSILTVSGSGQCFPKTKTFFKSVNFEYSNGAKEASNLPFSSVIRYGKTS